MCKNILQYNIMAKSFQKIIYLLLLTIPLTQQLFDCEAKPTEINKNKDET